MFSYVFAEEISVPEIIKQPVDQTVTFGDTRAVFNVKAQGTGSLFYQWYKGSVEEGNKIPGASSPVLTIENPAVSENNGAVYYCKISSDLGGSVISGPASLYVQRKEIVLNFYFDINTNPPYFSAELVGAVPGTNPKGVIQILNDSDIILEVPLEGRNEVFGILPDISELEYGVITAKYIGVDEFNYLDTETVMSDIDPAKEMRLPLLKPDSNIFTYGDEIDISVSGGITEALISYTLLPLGTGEGELTDSKLLVSTSGNFIIRAEMEGDEWYNPICLNYEVFVKPKPVVLDKISIKHKTYDGTNKAEFLDVPEIAEGGILEQDINNVSLDCGTAVFADINAGNNKTVLLYAFFLEGIKSVNYEIISPKTETADIIPAVLTAAAENQTIKYGEEIDTKKFNVSGFVGNQSESTLYGYKSPFLVLAHSRFSASGIYSGGIEIKGGNPTDNYQFHYVFGDLTVLNGDIQEKVHYTVTGPDNESGWFTSTENPFIITPKWDNKISGYDLIWDKRDGTFKSELIFTEDTEMTEVDFFLKDSKTGAVSNHNTASYKMDSTKPGNLQIKYSPAFTVYYNVLTGITFGYYNNTDYPLYVTLSSRDETSHVKLFTLFYSKQPESGLSAHESEAKVISDNIRYSNDQKTASASVTLTAEEARQYRGSLYFTAEDNAGNVSAEHDGRTAEDKNNNVSEHIVIVDTVSPELKVTYTAEKQTVGLSSIPFERFNSLSGGAVHFYDGEITAEFEIKEANFYPEDVDIQISQDGKRFKQAIPEKWEKSAGTDVYTGRIVIYEDGDYVIACKLKDRSGNEMVSYISETLVIDTGDPEISVIYDPGNDVNTVNGRKYYNDIQTAEIVIKEHNFRPDDVEVFITAEDLSGQDIAVEDYASYLKNPSSWYHQGDIHKAAVIYSTDANYTFDISYNDLSLRQSKEYVTDLFTVDKTPPDNLTVVYSESVLDKVIQSITFGYYKGVAEVTVTAEDNISGIDYFIYSGVKSGGVSEVNASVANRKIESPEISYFNSGKGARVRFTVPEGAMGPQNQFNGTVEFSAVDRSENSSELKDDKRIVTDAITPEISVQYSQPSRVIGGKSYYADSITAALTITEANFYPEDLSLSVVKNGNKADIASYALDWTNNGDVWTSSMQISDDGEHEVLISYDDRSGNKAADYTSDKMIIDTEKPVMHVSGIKHESANKTAQIGFTITAEDSYLDETTFKTNLTAVKRNDDGSFGQVEIDIGDVQTVIQGKQYSFTVDNLEEDAVYSLTAIVSDLPGNTSGVIIADDSAGIPVDKFMFSVNRAGSVFWLDDATMKLADDYYRQEVQSDLVIYEVNADPLQSYEIKLNENNIVENKDYTVNKSIGSETWNRYTYIIPKELASEENTYHVVLTSVDKADTVSYSDIKNAEISFVVDRTKPVVTISGLENNGRYQVAFQKSTLIPEDPGGELSELRVTLKDRYGNEVKNLISIAKDELLNTLETADGKIEIEVPPGIDQQVQITCKDAAGNEYINNIKNITVSNQWQVILYMNKPLFLASIAGGVLIIIGVIAVLFVSVRKRFSKGRFT